MFTTAATVCMQTVYNYSSLLTYGVRVSFIACLLLLQYVLCGLAEINVADWERNTVYSNGYKADDDAVIWFWKVCVCMCAHLVSVM